ncbi:recombinase family protein [Lysinibacillus sphaericus]|nr:recombinase family protein [Lysinibacillus sphaericus]
MVKELSRLARNGALSYDLKDIFDLHNIHLVCLDNSVNTLEKNDVNYGLFAWLYEMESNNNSRRNKQAKRVKAKQGLYVGSNPPYGYRNEKGKLIIQNDETPEVVRRIFKEYLEGKGMDSIAKGLFNEHIPTPSQIIKKKNASSIWHSSTIKNILTNRHYCGDLVQIREETISIRTIKRREIEEDERIISEGTHEPIISFDTFKAVEKMLQKRTKIATAPSTHLFSNLIFCEDCGKGLWYRASSKHYRCGGYIRRRTLLLK